MKGIKQFLLEFFNFIVNLVIMVAVFFIVDLAVVDKIQDANTVKVSFIIMAIFFFLCLVLQNVFFKSIFDFFCRNEITCDMKNPKIGIVCHNIILNTILVGTIVVSVVMVAYFIELIPYCLLLLEIIPCFIKKYSKCLSCYLFKIETIKTLKKPLENDGILL